MSNIISEDDHLAHYGILRRSGRYPWGSGEDSYSRSKSFLGMVEDLRKQGLSDTEIARGFSTEEHPFTTTDLRNTTTIARNAKKQADIAMAVRLKQERGWSNVAIGERMGINESSVRALLKAAEQDKADVLTATSNLLREKVDANHFIDVGSGVESHLGISKEKLGTAVALLKDEGYQVHYVKMEQLGTGNMTTMKVLVPPGMTYSETYKNRYNIQQIKDFSPDGGRSYLGLQPPLSVSSKRIAVRYAEDGGTQADGVIFVRPGVEDVSIGAARYAQVRIAVDGTHYLKGMAVYKDDLPDGVDLMFNTNKSNTGNKLDAMKELKSDPDNPFGAIVRQRIDEKTGKVTSAMNIVGSPSKQGSGEEGSWDTWSRNLPSQFLSKQSKKLAQQQLDMTYENKKAEFDEIMNLTNPAVRKKLLESFADGADSSAIHLKAAQLPRQSTHVILPVNSMKPSEIYAPNFNNGERVVLVRFPHGGTFEIPELTVNNNHPEAKKLLGRATDAVGIHHDVAARLSGADFDGDTVLVIPNNKGEIKTSPALERLKGFDPQRAYPAYEGMPKMSARTKQIEMGKVSNLITDMSIKGATNDELARAVRHSMVVIDAEKHNLNYRQSARDHGITQLREKYQNGKNGGASTLISNSGVTSTKKVNERIPRKAKDGGPIDPATGKKVYVETGATYVNRKGETVFKKDEVPRLALTDNAHDYSSGMPIEAVYADHSNRMKALANAARKEMIATQLTPRNPSSAKAYADEVSAIDAKLKAASWNKPLERQAQVLANAVVKQKTRDNPDMESDEIKKLKSQALTEMRTRTGAQKQKVEITDREWEAIQAGAVSNHKLTELLNIADLDRVKELATPRTNVLMTSVKKQRAQSMLDSGYTQAEVANALGVSLTTLKTGIQ